MKQRKDGRWVKKITINGKQIYFYSLADTERKAQKDIERQLIEYKTKIKKASSNFGMIADEWNSFYRETHSDINYKKNLRAAYNFVYSRFKECDINDIEYSDIMSYIYDLILMNYAKKTIATHKSILNMIFRYALAKGYIRYNIISEIRLPSNLPETPRKMPSTEEIKIVDSHYTGFDFFPYFLLYTGLRKSEALALEYEDIDYKNKTIRISKRLIHDSDRPIIEEKTKTKNSARYVVLLDRVFEKLPKRKKGLIFSDNGKPYTLKRFRTEWSHYQQRYGITLTAHQLRHAYATMLFESGVDVKDAQELMGHSDINLTRQIYTHIRNERKIETVNKLNSFSF